MTYMELWHRLTAVYDAGEAKAVARMVLQTRFQLSMTDILIGKDTQLSASDQEELEKISLRLLRGEPVQYVLGRAEFGGRWFRVEPGVLIPRPETYELCQWIMRSERRRTKRDRLRILDVGTGSGCIACTLAAELPQAAVTAWDISEQALIVARDNAARLGVKVAFERQDALSPPDNHQHWDVIVSNPPYVAEHERAAMAPHVKDHEPPEALFVSDADPLLFYRAIAHYAAAALRPGGSVYFEINPLYKDELERLLADAGLTAVETRRDQFGKPRMTKACRPKHP